MQAGDLRTAIRIQYRKVSGSGVNKTTAWVDLGNNSPDDPPRFLRCCWYPIAGKEAWVADSFQIVDAANVQMRYRADVTAQCRLLKDGVAYEILDPSDPDQHRQWIKFKVKGAVNGG